MGDTQNNLLQLTAPLWLAFSIGLCWLAGCHRSEPPETSQPGCLSDTMAKMIRVESVRENPVEDEIKLTGKIGFDREKVMQVYPPAGGTAKEVRVELGDSVQKGQVLAVVQSGEVAGYEQDRVAAQANLEITKKNLEATQDLFKAGVASEKDYVQAQKDFEQAQAQRRKIDQIFKLYQVGQGAEYVLRSPIRGFVVEKKLNRDMIIRADRSDNLFTISSLDEVWVLANVYESDISKIQQGYAAEVTTLSYPDQVFHGKVDKVFNVIDPDSKALQVRIRLANPGYRLKPEMFAMVSIHYTEKNRMIEIPSQSLIFDQNKNFVVVYSDPCHYQTREIQVYRTVGDKTFLRSGLSAGAQVVSQYQLLLYQAGNG